MREIAPDDHGSQHRSRWAAAAHLAVADADRPALERAIAATLADAPRPGAPATFTAEQIIHIINLARRPPDQLGRPVTAWTPRELAGEAVKQGHCQVKSDQATRWRLEAW